MLYFLLLRNSNCHICLFCFVISCCLKKIAAERDDMALRNRYKKIMKSIRAYNAWESANARATGGGPSNKPPDSDGIIVTGSLLSLKSKCGVGISGLASFDCDNGALPAPIFSSKSISSNCFHFSHNFKSNIF